MLLLCSGEDSYRSLQKARELEQAFRSKYDAQGTSVERLPSGKEGVEQLLSSIMAASLFSSRRFIRADGLLSSCPKAKVDALVRALSTDPENTIIVNVEEGDLPAKVLQPFSNIAKLIHYAFPLQSPSEFAAWSRERAAELGVTDQRAISAIADRAAGDCWLFITEMQKFAALGSLPASRETEPSVYDVMDRMLLESPARRATIARFDDAGAIMAQIVGQTRAALLVQGGWSRLVHPFVAKKMSRMSKSPLTKLYRRFTSAFIASRTGLASADEVVDILG